MELRIDISKPREIADGLMILQSLAMAHRAAQEAQLNRPPDKEAPPAPTPPEPSPSPATAPEAMAEEGDEPLVEDEEPGIDTGADNDDHAAESDEPHINPALADNVAQPPATGETGEAKRSRGRPPNPAAVAATQAKNEAKAAAKAAARAEALANKPATAKQAAAQPVGTALRGIPARDLAKALEQASLPLEATPESEPEAAIQAHDLNKLNGTHGPGDLNGVAEPPATAATPEPIAEPPPSSEPAHEPIQAVAGEIDPDVTEIMKATTSSAEPAAPAFSDDEIFGPRSTPEPTAPLDTAKFEAMAFPQLERMWRDEGTKRGVHWMRALIEKHNVRGPAELTREMIIEVLSNPDSYMPPQVA